MNQAYHNTTVVHPVGLAALVALCILILVLDRRHAVIPYLLLAVFMPAAQRIVLGGLDFTYVRIAVIIGAARVLFRREQLSIQFTNLDRSVLLWAIIATLTYFIQQRSIGALLNRFGYMIETAGAYFVFRAIVRDTDDIRRIGRAFMAIAIPILLLFLVEKTTGRNLFSVFGGVPETTVVREGRLRVQGSFAHPILAGTFWAVLIPFVMMTLQRSETKSVRHLLIVACFGAIVILTASSTPILSALSGLVGMVVYFQRRFTKWIPLLSLLMFVALDIAMEAPVWHLISRIDLSGGSTGWHRYWLVEQAIRNVDQWLLVGTPSIDSWGVWANDITNQYVLEAVRGGLPTLIAFLAIFRAAFRSVGQATRVYANLEMRHEATMAWSVGSMLFAHIVSFIAVSYFGEILILLFLGLSMAGTLAQITNPVTSETNTANVKEALEWGPA